MKNEEGISVFPATGELRDQRKFLYCRDRRNFLYARSTELAINGILEFRDRWNFCIRDRRNFVIFAIDGIFYVRDRRIFVMFAIDGIFIFRDRRIK